MTDIEVTIRLTEGEGLAFIKHLVEMGKPFSVAYPGSIAAATVPQTVEESLTESRQTVEPKKRTLRRMTDDGRTSNEVVQQKVRSLGTKRFHLSDIENMARSTGFHASTLRQKLQELVRNGEVEKIGRYHFRALASKPSVADTAETPPVFNPDDPLALANHDPATARQRAYAE